MLSVRDNTIVGGVEKCVCACVSLGFCVCVCWVFYGGYFYIGSNVRMGRGNRFRPLLMHEFRGVSVPPGLNLK